VKVPLYDLSEVTNLYKLVWESSNFIDHASVLSVGSPYTSVPLKQSLAGSHPTNVDGICFTCRHPDKVKKRYAFGIQSM